VVDLGEVEVTFQGKTQRKHKVAIVWQLDEEMADGRPFLVRRRFTCSLHPKSALRQILEAWRGRAFSDQELAGFDLETLIGVGAIVSLIHETRDGTTYSNVSTVMKLAKGMTSTSVRDYVRVCDRPPAQADGAEDGVGNLGITDDDVPF
jgi:hypothetical protein